MAHGLPVITSNRSALPEVAGRAALLVDPENTDELAEGLRRLAGDEDLRTGLADEGKKRAAQFSWDRAVQSTYAVYQEAVS
jgi:glycosyltransferase involved in cell wall biosynthesis